MDASKRRRAGTDRLGNLPDCLLHDVLSHLGSRQVVQTSALSRRWTNLWRDVLHTNVVIDEREFAGSNRERFRDFADDVVPSSVPPETPPLDAFCLNLTSWRGSAFAAERWIRRGLRRVPAAVDVRYHAGTIRWQPHRSDTTGGSCTRRVTMLCLAGVVLQPGFLESLGRYYPALEHLRLELAYDGQDYCPCQSAGELATRWEPPAPLPSLAEATIRLTDTSHHDLLHPSQPARNKRKLQFFKFMLSFMALLPNIQKLCLAGFTATSLLEEEFPVLHSLKTLILEGCEVGVKLQALTAILSSTPSVEMLELHHCTFLLYTSRRNKGQEAPKDDFWCQKLKSIQVKSRREDERHLAFDVLSKISEGMQVGQWLQVMSGHV